MISTMMRVILSESLRQSQKQAVTSNVPYQGRLTLFATLTMSMIIQDWM